MAEALAGGITSLASGAINEIAFEGPARRQYNADMERYSEERFSREKASIDKHNADVAKERGRTLQAQKAVAYRTSVVQLADAKRQAQRFHLLSQDFLNAAGAKKAEQVVAYAGSGALVKGSALVRMRETQQRADIGAKRLRKAADIALRRGTQQAQITRDSVIEQMYVPTPDPIKQPTIPQRSTWSPVGSFFGGFAGGIQNDYSKGNWPFGGGGGGGSGVTGFPFGGSSTGPSTNPWNPDPWGATQRGGYNY